jgi:hypothetical protein
MAFGKPGFKKGGFKKGGFAKKSAGKNYDNTKITGLWKTKRPGLFVGTANELEEIIALVKKARAAGKGITFFLWKNDQDDYAAYNLVANVAQDNPNRKEIQEEEEQEEEEEPGDDL